MSEMVLHPLQLLLRDDRATPRPRERPRRIFVDPSGRLHLGEALRPDDRLGLAEVPQKTFA